MRIIVGGASGFLGAPLVSALRDAGHDVTTLVRHEDHDPRAVRWDPAHGIVDDALIAGADVVVNLSGAPISQWPRTAARRREITASRLSATSTLAEAIARSDDPPMFVSGSGMSWYGVDRGDDRLNEESGPGTGFLAEVAQRWEDATALAFEAGAKVAHLRTSIVLDDSGGALKLMKVPFVLGVGGRLGSGRQWFSTISRRDWVRAVQFVIEKAVTGPVNLVAPSVVTNADFTRSLGRALHRPTVLMVPEFVIRPVLGSLADDLLGSLHVLPERLLDAGFEFLDPSIDQILATALS